MLLATKGLINYNLQRSPVINSNNLSINQNGKEIINSIRIIKNQKIFLIVSMVLYIINKYRERKDKKRGAN